MLTCNETNTVYNGLILLHWGKTTFFYLMRLFFVLFFFGGEEGRGLMSIKENSIHVLKSTMH